MADPKAFIHLQRATPQRQAIDERVRHWGEFYEPAGESKVRTQATRCMDCGVPFCQGDTGCPVRNIIPEWNGYVQRGEWRAAFDSLHATNNFPELTGRLCPAPCESACVLGVVNEPVAIRHIEQSIADRGFSEGWVVPRAPRRATGFSVAVIGSGPAGLAAAQQLRRYGHSVVAYEKNELAGGLLRFGIPEFKLEKAVLDLRLSQLEAEGVVFETGVNVGEDITVEQLRSRFDAICIATGAESPRDLPISGRQLGGIHFAMDFLVAQNRRLNGVTDIHGNIHAHARNVIIIGGGDTGSDCAGTCIRQGAKSVTQFELMPQPPVGRASSTPWPLWPMMLRTSHSHEEGCAREWSIATTEFSGTNGHVQKLHTARVETKTLADGRLDFVRVPGSEAEIDADLVLLAMGFTGPLKSKLLTDLGVEFDARGNIKTDNAHRTTIDGVFAAGDARRGQSLIVWSIREGRDAAESVNQYLNARIVREA